MKHAIYINKQADLKRNLPSSLSAPIHGRTFSSVQRNVDSLAVQHRIANHADPTAVPPIVHEVLHSPGQPLDAPTRAFMERRLGHDFSRVRIHTGGNAAESARLLDAQAYAIGHSLVFAAGQYNPTTRKGKGLLAHELVHAAQQEVHTLQRKTLVSDPTDTCEQQADRLAGHVVLDSHASPQPRQSRLEAPGAMILRYRSGKEQFFGRESDPARGLVEETFRDPKNQPWIERINVTFDGSAVDRNSDLVGIPVTNRLISTGKLQATYNSNKAARPPINCAVGGGSAILGLTDSGSFEVKRIEGVGYNAALQPGDRPAAPRIPGTKYTKDPDPGSSEFAGQANMHYAVFYNNLQALHVDGPDGLRVGSHACVHVENPPMQQINYHSVEGRTKVSISYSSAEALTKVCCARLRQTGLKRNPCKTVSCS